MATYATLTINAEDIIGADFDPSRASVWIEANTPHSAIVVDGQTIRVGGRSEKFVDGVATFELVTTNSADNPTSFSYRGGITYIEKGSRQQGRKTLTISDFPFTASANLAAIEEAWSGLTIPPIWYSDFRTEMETLKDATEAIAGADTADDLIVALDADATSAFRVQQDARAGRRGVLLADYPRQGAESHDSARLTRAIAASVANGSRTVIIRAADTVTLNSTVTVADAGVRIVGLGWQSVIATGSDIIGLEITGEAVELHNLTISTPQSNRTVFPVRTTNCARPYFNHVFFAGQTNSRYSGVFLNGGSEARFKDCLFNHACARVETYDVKFESCYIWAMTCDYGIALLNGAGNLTILNCDIVPPLRSYATGKAGIWIPQGLQTKILGTYLDGNGALQTREGIMTGDGAGQILMQGITSNNMASDVIVVDSSYNVLIDGYSGYSNNRHANNSREIVVRQTGVQAVQNVRISNAQFLQTQAVQDGGTAKPAVEVESPVDGHEVAIEGFDVKQPAGGGGYSNPEIKCDAGKTSLAGRGTLSRYSARGAAAFASGATGVTVTLSPVPMAYRPLASDINIVAEGDAAVPTRVQFVNDNQIFIPFASAATGPGNIHWKVDLRR